MTRPDELPSPPPSESMLRAESPVRAWLMRHRGHSHPDAGSELLGALVSPEADWVDQAVGYAALGEIELSPEERADAYDLLAQAQQPPRWNTNLLTRLGKYVITVGPPTIAASFLFAMLAGAPGLGLGFAGVCVLPLLCYAGSETQKRRRFAWVRHAAADARARLDGQENTESTGPPLTQWQGEPAQDHSLRMWLARRQVRGIPGSSASLLRALATPGDNRTDHVLGLQALTTYDLSAFERTRAGHLIAKALQVTGVEGNRRRRIYHAAAFSHLSGLGIGVIISFVFCLLPMFHTSLDLMNILLLLVVGCGILCGVAGLWTVFTTPLFFVGLLLEDSKGEQAVYRAAVAAAAAIGGPECLATLNEHVSESTPVRKEALAALREVLPRVTTDWYGRLPAETTAILRKIAISSNEDLAWLGVDAIGRVGGGNCVDLVARLAQHAPSREVQRRAAAVLPLLIERRKQEDSAASLLRAGSPPATEHLLHPLYTAVTDTPDTTDLLHISSAPEAEGGGP